MTPIANPNGEDSATSAGAGLGSLVDMTGSAGSGLSGAGQSDPFAITTGSMNGGNGVLGGGMRGGGGGMGGGTSASAAAGFGGGSPTSALASRRQSRAQNSSGTLKASTGLIGAFFVVAALML